MLNVLFILFNNLPFKGIKVFGYVHEITLYSNHASNDFQNKNN